MKQEYKELISKRVKDINTLSQNELEFIAELYKHYAVRKEISNNNKKINNIFGKLKSSMPKGSDIKYFYNVFNEAFYGSSLQEYLYIEDDYHADSPDEDFSDCVLYKNKYNETPEYLSSLSEDEFNELIEKSKENPLRQAALILYSSRPKERLVDRAPIDLKVAYANMQHYFIKLYQERVAKNQKVETYNLVREAGQLARESSSNHTKFSYKYSNDTSHEYEDCVLTERIDFTNTPITILSLFEQYLRQESKLITQQSENGYQKSLDLFKQKYLLTNEQKETFKSFYNDGTIDNIAHYIYFQSINCSNEISRIRQRNKGIDIKFSEDDKEFGDEE